jgi:uncharacterized protein (DUF305 family)
MSLLICISTSSCSNQTNSSDDSEMQDTTSEHGQSYIEDTSIKGIMITASKFLENYDADVNNDRGFAEIMIYFSHAAINMSNVFLSKGENAALIKSAQASVASRKNVIKEMNLFLQKEPKEKSSSSREFQKSVKEALSEMKRASGFQENDIDRSYVQSMIVFHQTCINITKAELRYGSHQTLKIHARNMLSAEIEELQQLQSLLNRMAK